MEPFKVLLNSKKFSQHLAELYLQGFDGKKFKDMITKKYLIEEGFLPKLYEKIVVKVEVVVENIDNHEKKLKSEGEYYYIGVVKITVDGLELYIPCPEREKLVNTFNEEKIKKWVDNDDPNDFRVPEAFCIYTTG